MLQLLSSLALSLSMVVFAEADNMSKFDEHLAREKLLALSAGAYSSHPEKCLQRKLPGAAIMREVSVNCDRFKDKCYGFVALSPEDQAIIITFRGTNKLEQLLAETEESAFEKHTPFEAGGQVSEYWNDAFMDVWKGGLNQTFSLISSVYPSYKLWITGHSLGGVMASMAAATVSAQGQFPPEQIVLVTFGQPRTGNRAFADSFDKLVPQTFRVTHKKDIVPHLPFEILAYYHHSQEIFYPNDMTGKNIVYKTCGRQEDKACSDGQLDLSVGDHLRYYGKDIPLYGIAGCI